MQVNQNVVHSLDKLLVIAWQMCKRNRRGYKGYKGCFNIFPKHTLISFYISGPHNMEYIITQSGRGYKGLQSLSGCHFYQKRSNILIFYIVGGMCASLICQSFKTQLNILPSKLPLPSSFSSFSWHMRIWALGYLKNENDPLNLTYFTHTDSGIAEMSEFWPIKRS